MDTPTKNRGGRPQVWDETGRVCLGCGEHKPLPEFQKVRSSKSSSGVYYKPYCRACRTKDKPRPERVHS